MGYNDQLFTGYLVNKQTGEERYVSSHRKLKDCKKAVAREQQARSPKLFDTKIVPKRGQ